MIDPRSYDSTATPEESTPKPRWKKPSGYYKSHKGPCDESTRRWREAHREEYNAYHRAYRKAKRGS